MDYNRWYSERPGDWRTSVGVEAETRLIQLGFEVPSVLRNSIQEGASARRSTTLMHPLTYGGYRMWAESTASLAHACREWGFEHQVFRGVDLVASSSSGRAIILTAGDSATADPLNFPQVRYRRRSVITRLVNGELDNLFSADKRPEWEVWFLLHHFSRHDLEVPAELSRPAEITQSGLVAAWIERVVIPSAGEPGPRKAATIPAPAAAPDALVERRAG